MHWAYLLRDDTVENPNSWRFYKKFQSFDVYYLGGYLDSTCIQQNSKSSEIHQRRSYFCCARVHPSCCLGITIGADRARYETTTVLRATARLCSSASDRSHCKERRK
ncbi:hypothetical protein GCK32_012626 [Trichostrongylus colubriformis]|uniref:Uncharacterized protein n=1 Tax=Trichostrongylus colubriformis TaxID=6319 RepID=A0AAN8IR04_TRICO